MSVSGTNRCACQCPRSKRVRLFKRAIEKLSPQERCELEALLHPWPDDDWDRQMQADAEPGGKLHEMMSASRKNAQAGKLADLPFTR
jgi:hypothetical protein